MSALFSYSDDQKTALLEGIQTACRLCWGPDDAHCREMLAQGLFSELEPLADVLNIDPPDALERLDAIIGQHPDRQTLFGYLETAYVRLFVSNRKGFVIPLYHSCYEYDQAAMMKERLAAVDLSLGAHIKEPPDHLAVELEYLHFLLTRGWADGNVLLVKDASSFAADTLLPWIAKLQSRLLNHSDASFYLLVMAVIIAILQYVGNCRK